MSKLIKDQSLYFIALIPPPPIYNAAQKWKEYFATEYDSKASLNSPPHITLHMPFKLSKKKEEKLIYELTTSVISCSTFDLTINGFDAFAPRSIFMNVEAKNELNVLQKHLQSIMKTTLNIFNANYQGRPFHPHLTLAFRDLKKDKFELAWNEFKDKRYHEIFPVTTVSLLKHDRKRWQLFQSFSLAD